jgi:hypothetical protein
MTRTRNFAAQMNNISISSSASTILVKMCSFFDKLNCVIHVLLNLGNQVIELSVGRHQYPFTFVLPTQIPPSFEGSFGHIRYTIRSVAQRPWLKRDYACQTSLVVGSIVDLNTLPAAVVH